MVEDLALLLLDAPLVLDLEEGIVKYGYFWGFKSIRSSVVYIL